MSKQDQRVATGGTAIQAAGDVVVHQGLSPDQMSAIMIGLAGQLQAYLADAEAQADQRFSKFRAEVLQEFARPGAANPEAFREPDFQFLLRSAQDAYARSGSDDAMETIVKLLAERSKQASGSRTALVLNRAAEVVGQLTKEELAVLSVAFVTTRTSGAAKDLMSLGDRCKKLLDPFLDDLPTTGNAVDYLQSLGCISVRQFGGQPLKDVMTDAFLSILSDGFTQEEYAAALGDHRLPSAAALRPLVMPTAQGLLRFQPLSYEQIAERLDELAVPAPTKDALLQLAKQKAFDQPRFEAEMLEAWPAFPKLKAAWEGGSISTVIPTLLGVAVGLANVRRVAPTMNIPLDIWLH